MLAPSANFQVSLLARPAEIGPGQHWESAGHAFATVVVPREVLGVPFAIGFEEAAESLAQLERLFIEPDGSFVWVSSATGPRWQLDGVLYDRDDRLLFVDLKGSVPQDQFDRLLATLGWPATRLVFQLAREAVFMEEAEFRRFAWP